MALANGELHMHQGDITNVDRLWPVVDTTVVTNLNADLLDGSHAAAFAPAAHNILSATHGDATAAACARGDIISGQTATPKWTKLALGASDTYLRSNGTDLAYQRPGIEPVGFYDRGTSAFAMVGATFRLTGTYSYYYRGALITKTAATDDVDCSGLAAGSMRYMAFNAAGTLVAVAAASMSFQTYVPVATVYYDGTRYVTGEERHSYITTWEDHRWKHFTVGVRFVTGFGANLANPAAWQVDDGTCDDDGLEWSTGNQTQCRNMYRSGANMITSAANATYIMATTGVLDYDNAGALAAVASGEYVAYWVFATPDPLVPIYILVGQRVDNTLNAARANNTYQALSLGTLPSPEMKVLYRILLHRTGGAVNYDEVQDLRGISNLPSGTFLATDHGTLSGLADPDHVMTSVHFAATARLLGRGTAGAGSGEEIALSSSAGLSFTWAASSLNINLGSIKSGATQVAAGAAAGELWKTNGHATLPNNVVMIGV